MRIPFLVAVMAAGVFYSYIAFADLGFMTRTGRLGPGFFPRLIGVGIIVLSIWAILDELRARGTVEDTIGYWRDALTMVGMALIYAVFLKVFGGYIATVAFLLLALTVLNKGRMRQNLLLAFLIPTGVYALFDRVLNANMPPSMIQLPI
ncbi:tripartite tricarboxylate transporter TctB family protein [Tropicimonas sp. S265A]|uniref:tripartite tricarboxylate transporter TctB family protein n=1 Tax=Tropicimonas sp. S265A TaxID=3415134 RepID=UPI003C7E2266